MLGLGRGAPQNMAPKGRGMQPNPQGQADGYQLPSNRYPTCFASIHCATLPAMQFILKWIFLIQVLAACAQMWHDLDWPLGWAAEGSMACVSGQTSLEVHRGCSFHCCRPSGGELLLCDNLQVFQGILFQPVSQFHCFLHSALTLTLGPGSWLLLEEPAPKVQEWLSMTNWRTQSDPITTLRKTMSNTWRRLWKWVLFI